MSRLVYTPATNPSTGVIDLVHMGTPARACPEQDMDKVLTACRLVTGAQ